VAEQSFALESRLARSEARYQRWRWGWAAIYGGLAAGNLALAPLVGRSERVDYWTGGATSLIGLVPLVLLTQPKPPPSSTAAVDPAARLARLEANATEAATFQRESHAWPSHAINMAFNAAVSAFLGFGFGHWRSAALNLAVGISIGEVQIATQQRSSRSRRLLTAGARGPRGCHLGAGVALKYRKRSTNTVADGAHGGCYLVGRWSLSKPRVRA